jgi:hypothetical protein
MISPTPPQNFQGGDGARAGAISSAKGLHALVTNAAPKSRWGVGKIIFPTFLLQIIML